MNSEFPPSEEQLREESRLAARASLSTELIRLGPSMLEAISIAAQIPYLSGMEHKSAPELMRRLVGQGLVTDEREDIGIFQTANIMFGYLADKPEWDKFLARWTNN